MEDLASPGGSRSGSETLNSEGLMREAMLILGGSAEGIRAAALKAVHNPEDSACKIGLSALLGGGLALAQGRAGMLRLGAEVVGLGLTASFGLDAAGRIGVVAHAMTDTWRSDKNLAKNTALVAATVGPLVVDSALMSVGGLAGAKLARVPSVYMNVHQNIDKLRGNSMMAQQEALGQQMLAYHPGTAYHQERVGDLSLLLAKQMRLPPAAVETAYFAGKMHDTGKLKTPLAILDFTGETLDPAQRAVINKHPVDSAAILSQQVQYPGRLKDVPMVTERHHERLDGQGTPNRLAAAEIPIETRINSVADVFDALSHQRSYKDPTPVKEILALYARGRGSQFDAQAVDAFMTLPADRVVAIMLSDGGHSIPKSSTSPFKNVSIGELLQASAADYPVSDDRVSMSMIERFNNFYGPAHLREFTLPDWALQHRLSPAHL